MEAALFDRFRDIAYNRAGIHLREGKESLVAARVAKRQRALGLHSDGAYLRFLEEDESGDELVQFLDAISTNFTSFYRESDHFDLFGAELRRWIEAGQRRIRIWCAASSSGEEPYTLAITALEALNDRPLDVRILATDISTRVLQHAQAGRYEAKRLEPVSRDRLRRYFVRSKGEELYEVAPPLRALLTFKRLNLAKPPWPMRGPLDAIFCRNVMMYFDQTVRQRLVTEATRLLRPGGLFFVGHAETLSGLSTDLVARHPSVYALPAGPSEKRRTSRSRKTTAMTAPSGR
jgi:chemotaxis protein methyltransferase CheR